MEGNKSNTSCEMKQTIVEHCKHCPFQNMTEGGYNCNHPSSHDWSPEQNQAVSDIMWDLYEGVPDVCPLKTEAIQVMLKVIPDGR